MRVRPMSAWRRLVAVSFTVVSCFVEGHGVACAVRATISELEDNNELKSATVLPLNQAVSGTINPLKDLDYYTLQVPQAGLLSMSLTNIAPQLEPFLALYNSQGARLALRTVDAAGLSITLEQILSEGQYSLTVGDTPGRHMSWAPYLLETHLSPSTPIMCGQSVRGSLSKEGEKRLYHFTADANDRVIIHLAASDIPMILELYGPNGRRLNSFEALRNASDTLTKTLPVAGTYTVLVRASFARQTGSYGLAWQRLNNPCGAMEAPCGQTLSGRIDFEGQGDFYSFSATANDRVTVRLNGISYRSILELYGPDGTRLAAAEADYDGRIDQTLPITGTYTLLVRAYWAVQTLDYRLIWQRLNNPCYATPISYGQTTSGAINPAGEIDAYTFTATINDVVTIQSGWPAMELYQPDGTWLASSSSGVLTSVIPATGTYALLVRANRPSDTGTYTLKLQRNDPIVATPLSFGQTLSANLAPATSIKAYTVTAQANDQLYLRFARLTQTSGSFTPFLALHRSDGTRLTTMVSDSGVLTATVPSTGTYTLFVADDNSDGTGTYELTLQRTNNPANASALVFGQTVSGAVRTVTGINAYIFTAQANDRLDIHFARLTQTGGSFTPFLALYQADGTQLAETNSGVRTTTAPATGTYYLFMMAWNRRGTGTYELTLQRPTEPTTAADLAFGQTVSGTLSTVIEIDAYRFTATANDQLIVRFARLTQSGGSFTPAVTLLQPDGTRLTNATGILAATAPLTGSYTLFVADENYDSTGTYEVTLQRSNNPADATPLAFGQTVTGTLSTITAIKAYTVTAQANDRLDIRFASANRSSTFLELYKPDGTLLKRNPSGTLTTTAPLTGSYTIFVTLDNLGRPDTYELTLQRTNNPANARELPLDQPVTGTLSTITAIKAYTFTATANAQLDIRFARDATTAGWFLPLLELYNPDGTLLNSDSSGTLTALIPSTGSYTLFVTNFYLPPYGTGSYTLTFRWLRNPVVTTPANATPLAFGQTVSSVLGATEIHAYRFAAAAGDRLYIRFDGQITGKNRKDFDLTLEFYGLDGIRLRRATAGYELFGDYRHGELTATAPSTGTYTLLMTEGGRNAAGPYTLTLQRTNNPANATALAFDQTVTGALSTVTEVHAYTIAAAAGDTLKIIVEPLTQTSGQFNPRPDLYKPDGTWLGGSNSGILTITVPATGTYTLFVTEFFSYPYGTGTYQLRVQR